MHHGGGHRPDREYDFWEYTGEVELLYFGEGLVAMGSGAGMFALGVSALKAGGIGVFGVMYGSMSFGFGLGQSIQALKGYRPVSPMNFPTAVERGFGGSGMYGTALDGVINFGYSTTNLERMYHGFNTYRNIQSVRTVNPPPTYQYFEHRMVPASTRVVLPVPPQ